MLGAVFQPLTHSLRTLSSVACDLVRLLVLVSRSRRALAGENLFLRKQLALFQERKVKPRDMAYYRPKQFLAQMFYSTASGGQRTSFATLTR